MWHVYGSQTNSPLNDAVDEFNQTVGMYIYFGVVYLCHSLGKYLLKKLFVLIV